jgi:hypothetical protein
MAENLNCVGIFCGEDGNFRVTLERAREVDEVAVGACYESFLCQSGRYLVRDLCGSGTARNFAGGAIGQSDLNGFSAHAGSSSFLEITSLLARIRPVKARRL